MSKNRSQYKGFEDWIQIFETGTHTDSQSHTRHWSREDLQSLMANHDPEHPAPLVVGHPASDDPRYGQVGEYRLDEDGAERPIQINLRGMLREVDMGNWKPGDKGTLKVMMALSYYKLTHSGQVMIEIDPTNMVRIIDGQDQLRQTRAHLGL